jgi:YVTN family beta-propeller protein
MGVLLGSLSATTASTASVSIQTGAVASGPTIYVTGGYSPNTGDDDVYPVNATTHAVGTAIAVGGGPTAIAITPDGATAYVVNRYDTFEAINSSTNMVGPEIPTRAFATTNTGLLVAIAIAPDGKTAYSANNVGDQPAGVVPIDLMTNTPGSAMAVKFPEGIAFTPDGKTAYVVDNSLSGFPNDVVPVKTATNTPGPPIHVGQDPRAIAITPDGKTLYVTSHSGNAVTPISTSTNAPGTHIHVGSDPSAIAITPDGNTVYVANAGDGTVTPIPTSSNTPGAPIHVGGVPTAIAITPDGKTAYIAEAGGTLVPIATATNAPGKPIKVGTDLTAIAISPDEAPVAVLSVVPAAVGSGKATQFSAVGSAGPTSPIVSYRWNFGDGTTETTSAPKTKHVYASPSKYAASVTETDAVGTSTSQVFTGQTMLRNGGPSAVAKASVVIVSCTTNQTCDATVSAAQSSSAPAQSVEASGMPTAAQGTLQLAVAPASLICLNEDPSVAPVVDQADTGFASTSSLTVTMTLQHTIRASAHHVCYSSSVPFLSQSSPTTATAGTALLLTCAQTGNVAPCVVSTAQVGTNVVVTFLDPGGDPRYHVPGPPPLQINFPSVPNGTANKEYTARLTTSGGIAPIIWSVARGGHLPNGVALGDSTGAITGKPAKKGRSTFTLKVTDSETPPETAKLTISITIK